MFRKIFKLSKFQLISFHDFTSFFFLFCDIVCGHCCYRVLNKIRKNPGNVNCVSPNCSYRHYYLFFFFKIKFFVNMEHMNISKNNYFKNFIFFLFSFCWHFIFFSFSRNTHFKEQLTPVRICCVTCNIQNEKKLQYYRRQIRRFFVISMWHLKKMHSSWRIPLWDS